jgi:FMN phosphatase YigB (HAD superfamily)
MVVRAVLFDLGNTLVNYYGSSEFPPILRNCLRQAVSAARRGQDRYRVEYPLGGPAASWKEELARHGRLDQVDAVVFCVDVGWRKPHPDCAQ